MLKTKVNEQVLVLANPDHSLFRDHDSHAYVLKGLTKRRKEGQLLIPGWNQESNIVLLADVLHGGQKILIQPRRNNVPFIRKVQGSRTRVRIYGDNLAPSSSAKARWKAFIKPTLREALVINTFISVQMMQAAQKRDNPCPDRS